MNDLRILIARLGWPSTSSRWWTMQELATRLVEPATRIETELSLLQLLRSRKLEAEVIEVLCIFWIASQNAKYRPPEALPGSILKPSPLSDLIVKSLGLSAHFISMDLNIVQDDFEFPNDFDGVQGFDLPRIFQTSMQNLEAQSKLPFVQQMAFEWVANRAAYPQASHQGDPAYFVRSLGEGFISLLSARAALRAISAYLRTLAVAKQFWGMPSALVDQKSLLTLPVHPTLAQLRPKLPDWFPASTEFDDEAATTETSFRALISRVKKSHPGDELIAFSSPIIMSMERCVEISLIRWSQPADRDIEGIDLARNLDFFWKHGQDLSSQAPTPLSTTTIVAPPTLNELTDKDSGAWPLAGTLDLRRIGYLQHDLYPSRLFLPTMPSVREIIVTPQEGQLRVEAKNQIIANLRYWNVGWGPVRPGQLGGNCGTALISKGKTYRNGADADCGSLRSFYLWQVRTLHRESSFGEFNETLKTGVIFI